MGSYTIGNQDRGGLRHALGMVSEDMRDGRRLGIPVVLDGVRDSSTLGKQVVCRAMIVEDENVIALRDDLLVLKLRLTDLSYYMILLPVS